MLIPPHHPWNLPPKEAIALQRELSHKVVLKQLERPPQIVAGVDVSYDRGSDLFFAGIILLTYPGMEPVEEATADSRVTFPYIPGLLSFREGPVVLKAFEKLKGSPDLIIFDGQGIAHPRGVGIASHMGLILDIPSVGCAKTRLCGDYDEPGMEKGDYSTLTLKGEEVGAVLRTRKGVKPVFVSPGHMIDIKSSTEIILACSLKYRLPEPTRQAHLLVNRVRRGEGRASPPRCRA